MYEEIGDSQIAVILDDFVLKDEMIPEGVPRQFGNEAMILMEVVAIMREYDIRAGFLFQLRLFFGSKD